MTDVDPLVPALHVISVRAACVIAHGYTSSPYAYTEAMENLRHQIRKQVGGTLPDAWQRHVKYIPSRRGVICRVEFQAIKHEHHLQKRWVWPGAYVEECWTVDCDYQGDLVEV